MLIAWPAANSVYLKPPPAGSGGSGATPQWVGTVLQDGAGSTGMLYRRNRYYDPGTGQFTQQDPIGIAGGANVYGFANGDPINFADPFGLTPALVLPVAGAGVGVYIAGAGLIAAAAVLAEGDDLGAAIDAGIGAMGTAVQAVKGRIAEGQIRGQQKPIEEHFTKLANPNQPGGDDPNNRNKWKKDIQNAIDRQIEKFKKLKEGDRRDRMEQLIKSNQDRLKGVQ